MSRYLLLFSLALLSACSHTPSEILLTQSQDCPLTLAPGQQLTLALPNQPSTGYSWQLNTDALNGLTLLSHSQQASEEPFLIGAVGTHRWQFKATKPSEGHLSLDYQRPWEAEPIDSFECFIEIKAR